MPNYLDWSALFEKNPDLKDKLLQHESGSTLAQAIAKEKKLNNNVKDSVASYAASSKRKFVVDARNWGATKTQKPIADESNDWNVKHDSFRHQSGRYWTTQESENSAGSDSLTFFHNEPQAVHEDNIKFSTFVEQPVYISDPEKFGFNTDSLFFEVQQVVSMYADKKQFMVIPPKKDALPAPPSAPVYVPGMWQNYIGGLPEGSLPGDGTFGIVNELVDYEYLAFEVPIPQTEAELNNLSFAGQTHVVIKPEYNFYIHDYETLLRDDHHAVNERVLPNLYTVMMERLNEHSNYFFANHISLGGTMKPKDTMSVSAPNANKFDIKKQTKGYFSSWIRNLDKAVEGEAKPSINQLSQKFRNIIFPASKVPLLKEIESKKEMFPMYVDIEISTDKTAEFTDLLRETHLLDRFMIEIATETTQNSFGLKNFVEYTESQQVVENLDGSSRLARTATKSNTTKRMWNITKWIEKIALVDFKTGAYSPSGDEQDMKDAMKQIMVMDEGVTETLHTISPQNKFFHGLMGVIFLNKLKAFMKKKFRTYGDLLKGRSNYSETVFYRVEKRRTDPTGDPQTDILQSFWLPNLSDQDVVKLVDTQIKYDTEYTYSVYAYQLVIETLYNYHKTKVYESAADMLVTQKPQPILIEQLIHTETHLILDSPPCPPDLQIIPYFGHDGHLLLNLNSSIDDYETDPIIVVEEDIERFERIRNAQKAADGPIRFNSDDSVGDNGWFEVFRTTKHPKSWRDFGEDSHATLVVNQSEGYSIKASSASFLDALIPNVKYYYIARMVDAHLNVSNPTAVYEVELVNDSGSVFLRKKAVDFLPKSPQRPSKPMRRIIEIKPAIAQGFAELDDDTVDSAKDIKGFTLGNEISMWGKRYKFRFISKKTGKKIDFNITCKTKMEKGEPWEE